MLGTAGRARTDTLLLARDFESRMSTSSITAAPIAKNVYQFHHSPFVKAYASTFRLLGNQEGLNLKLSFSSKNCKNFLQFLKEEQLKTEDH